MYEKTVYVVRVTNARFWVTPNMRKNVNEKLVVLDLTMQKFELH